MVVTQTHESNAAFWDEIADTYWHGERGEAETIEFLRSGGNYLCAPERLLLGDLGTWCRHAIHLQCSGGNDALSLLHQGVAEVTGIDISERLLAVARRKAEALGARAHWVRSDVVETPHNLDGTADLVYTGKGALCWMMDITTWARVVARLLVPGGRFFIYEGHPLDWVWDMTAEQYVLDETHGDYFSSRVRERLFSRVTRAAPQYRQWSLGETINSLIAAGLSIESLTEYPEPFWDQFPQMPVQTLHRLPHTFALLARKR